MRRKWRLLSCWALGSVIIWEINNLRHQNVYLEARLADIPLEILFPLGVRRGKLPIRCQKIFRENNSQNGGVFKNTSNSYFLFRYLHQLHSAQTSPQVTICAFCSRVGFLHLCISFFIYLSIYFCLQHCSLLEPCTFFFFFNRTGSIRFS